MSRLVLVILALALAAPAGANVGRKHFPGTPTTEPNGLREIAIEREELRFDLRPVGAHGEAKVSAIYHLDNKSTAAVIAPLVFVSGASVAGGIDVMFGEVIIHGVHLSNEELAALPPSWKAPTSTPGVGAEGAIEYDTRRNAALSFRLVIPPGRHQLAVSYSARAQMSKGSETLRYQLGYILAPARDWGSFGTLDVVVEVPPGWRVATSPVLARTGDTLRGRFPSLPADTLGITIQAPTGTLHAILQYALPLLALLVVIGGGYVLFAIGRARGRRTEDLSSLWPVSLPVSVCWAIAIGITGGFAAIRSDLAIPEGQSGAHGYGGAFGILLAIFVALLAIPIGVVIARAGRRAHDPHA
jgi:hypothetical protein